MYTLIRGQLLVSPGGDVIGLDYPSVMSILDLYNVEDKKAMFLQLKECFEIEQKLDKGS